MAVINDHVLPGSTSVFLKVKCIWVLGWWSGKVQTSRQGKSNNRKAKSSAGGMVTLSREDASTSLTVDCFSVFCELGEHILLGPFGDRLFWEVPGSSVAPCGGVKQFNFWKEGPSLSPRHVFVRNIFHNYLLCHLKSPLLTFTNEAHGSVNCGPCFSEPGLLAAKRSR